MSSIINHMNDARPAARGGEGVFFRGTQAVRGRAREDSKEKRIPPPSRAGRRGRGREFGEQPRTADKEAATTDRRESEAGKREREDFRIAVRETAR